LAISRQKSFFLRKLRLKELRDKIKILIFRSKVGIPLKNEAQRHSWAKICKVIWEIPVYEIRLSGFHFGVTLAGGG